MWTGKSECQKEHVGKLTTWLSHSLTSVFIMLNPGDSLLVYIIAFSDELIYLLLQMKPHCLFSYLHYHLIVMFKAAQQSKAVSTAAETKPGATRPDSPKSMCGCFTRTTQPAWRQPKQTLKRSKTWGSLELQDKGGKEMVEGKCALVTCQGFYKRIHWFSFIFCIM